MNKALPLLHNICVIVVIASSVEEAQDCLLLLPYSLLRVRRQIAFYKLSLNKVLHTKDSLILRLCERK